MDGMCRGGANKAVTTQVERQLRKFDLSCLNKGKNTWLRLSLRMAPGQRVGMEKNAHPNE